MDTSILTSGEVASPPTCFDDLHINQKQVDELEEIKEDQICAEETVENDNEITHHIIESNEHKLKSRIAQCKNVIESLKSELNEEKARLEREVITKQAKPDTCSFKIPSNYIYYNYKSVTDLQLDDLFCTPCAYNTSIDDKLNCDENLMEYEKQLQKYQNTLNMAQIEKKNAIRKQMLAKAYRLKLLEVENQCNIELLRVKQSLQCLEPLKIIASKWKTNSDDIFYDINNFEFIPRYPELKANSGSDINSYKEVVDDQTSEKPFSGISDDTN